MKKLLLILALCLPLLLCSCRKINQTDNDYQYSNTSDISSDYVDISSDYVSSVTSSLPERTDPADGEESDTNYGSHNTTALDEEAKTVTVDSLSIDMDKTYYRNTVKILTFTLYNEDKNIFTYYTDFFLQTYVDGEWKYYTTKSGEVEYKFNTKDAESYIEFVKFDLSDNYNLPLPLGTYRIVQESDYGTIVSRSFEIVDDSYFDGEQTE